MVMSSSRIRGATPTVGTDFSIELRRKLWGTRGPAPETARGALITGQSDRPAYELLLAQLRHVYGELERAAGALRTDPIAEPFLTDLGCRHAIDADLAQLRGANWMAELPLLTETHAYAQRVRRVAGGSAGSFVAHHYTRYLGDVANARAISGAAQRHLGLAPSAGCAFFTFAAISDPAAYRRQYRSWLDSAPWSDIDKQLIIAEALHAQRLDTALLVAVERAAHARRAHSTA